LWWAGVVAVWRVPWVAPPAPRADQLAALGSLPTDAVARGREFHAALRPGSYGGMLLGLVVALVLGLTPLGARIVEAVGRPFGGNWVAQAVLGGFLIVAIGEVVALPLAAWRRPSCAGTACPPRRGPAGPWTCSRGTPWRP
jgi:STE24 endopeptidase